MYKTQQGQSTRRFCFEAFLPHDKKERARILETLQSETRTIVLYEAPHHLKKTLQELRDTLGNRSLSICRELTKRYEEVQRTTLDDALSFYQQQEARGEYVLVICGKPADELEREKQKAWEALTLTDHMAHYESQGIPRKEAMRLVAKDRGISKREVYQMLLE